MMRRLPNLLHWIADETLVTARVSQTLRTNQLSASVNSCQLESGMQLEDQQALDLSRDPEAVDSIISRAISLGASDVHLEPSLQVTNIRFRNDGRLNQAPNVAAASLLEIVPRLKVLCNMDIVIRRRPQNGRF